MTSKHPPDLLVPMALATLDFPLIMFTPGSMPVFYLILHQAGFSDVHPGHKMA